MAFPTARNFLLRGSFLSSNVKRHAAVVRAVSVSRGDDFIDSDISDTDVSTYTGSNERSPAFENASTTEESEMLRHFRITKIDDPDTGKAIPSNFGAPDGPGISNKESILQDVDKAVSEGRPPDLEVLLADHLCYTGNSFMKAAHLTLLRYGHIAVRYTTKVWASSFYFKVLQETRTHPFTVWFH